MCSRVPWLACLAAGPSARPTAVLAVGHVAGLCPVIAREKCSRVASHLSHRVVSHSVHNNLAFRVCSRAGTPQRSPAVLPRLRSRAASHCVPCLRSQAPSLHRRLVGSRVCPQLALPVCGPNGPRVGPPFDCHSRGPLGLFSLVVEGHFVGCPLKLVVFREHRKEARNPRVCYLTARIKRTHRAKITT